MPTDDQAPAEGNGHELARAVLAGGGAELVAHVLGVGWLASPLQPALQLAFTTIAEADRRMYQQVAQALDIAIDETDGGAPQVERLALADPARTELFRRVVQAAGRSTLEAKIPALGRVLAQGLPDGDTVDLALVIADGLTTIEAPHLQVLHVLEGKAEMLNPDGTLTSLGPGWPNGALQVKLPGHIVVLPALLSTLERHGLVLDLGKSDTGGIHWTISTLGRLCLDLLREA